MATLIIASQPGSVSDQWLSPDEHIKSTPAQTLSILATHHGISDQEINTLRDIALCESGGRQVDSTGELLRGAVHPPDVGYFQINEKVHKEKSEELGLDVHTLPGNILYAIFLYKEYGTQPWSASKECWDKNT